MPQLAIGVGVTSTLTYLLYREVLSAILIGMPEFTTTYDIEPHAGDAGFDDSAWPTLPPTELAAKRGGGKVSFLWFRTRLTVPSRVGAFDPAGAKVVLALCVDDYAEIWVNGDLPRAAGRPSPATIQGFNMPQRLVLSDAVAPGDTFHIAVFGIPSQYRVVPRGAGGVLLGLCGPLKISTNWWRVFRRGNVAHLSHREGHAR